MMGKLSRLVLGLRSLETRRAALQVGYLVHLLPIRPYLLPRVSPMTDRVRVIGQDVKGIGVSPD